MVRSETGERAGAVLATTMAWKLFVALRAGEPLSVTITVMGLVVPYCAKVGLKVTTPLVVLIEVLAGGCSRLKVSDWAGRSVSWAMFVTISV